MLPITQLTRNKFRFYSHIHAKSESGLWNARSTVFLALIDSLTLRFFVASIAQEFTSIRGAHEVRYIKIHIYLNKKNLACKFCGVYLGVLLSPMRNLIQLVFVHRRKKLIKRLLNKNYVPIYFWQTNFIVL